MNCSNLVILPEVKNNGTEVTIDSRIEIYLSSPAKFLR